MNLATYSRRNLFRRKGRTILTFIAVAIAVLIFCVIRTVVQAWNIGAEEASKDRLATRHKVSIVMSLPKHYIEDVRSVPGIQSATWASWFGAKDPKERTPFFAGFAVDHDSWFTVMDEMQIDPAQLAEWKQTPNGAIIGDVLAKTLQVKVGDDVTIDSDIYPGNWKFKVIGIYKPLRRTVDRSTFVFRWDYLDNTLRQEPRNAPIVDHIGWVLSRISDPTKSAEVSRAIDKKFDERDDQTLTQSERAFNLSFLGAFSAVLSAFDVISIAILLIMTLILANAISMSARERTHEYGVLRAIGFSPGYIFGFVVGEAMLVALVGGLLGAGLVFLLINQGLGPVMEENMSGMFPYFRTPASILIRAVAYSTLLGGLAAVIPGILASRRKVVDALRRLD